MQGLERRILWDIAIFGVIEKVSIKTPNEDILIDAKHFFEYYAAFNNAVIALSDTDSCIETSFFLEYFS